MSESLLDNANKPLEILEIEKKYNINLKKVNFDYSSDDFGQLPNLRFATNTSGNVIGLAIQGVGIQNIDPICKLKFLRYLDLTLNQVEDISCLSPNEYLDTLYLRGNLIKDINSLTGFPNLLRLAILENKNIDTSPINRLLNIQELYCQSIELQSIDFLLGLNNLHQFSGEGNEISNISIIKYFDKCNFNFDNNLIRFVPKEVAEKYHWLSDSLSDEFLDKRLTLIGNPLEFPPTSVIVLGAEVTKEYYETSEKYGHTALSEGRIIVIGDGSSGKSSLIEKILYNSFDKDRVQTNGIKIDNLYLQHPEDNRNLSFHIWDFGGQEIQHAVHKFFFTEGCLYVLVLDNRKEEEPEYWLQQIESLGGKAPVLVVFNKQDENAAETADRKFLKEKYPNIIGFYNTSCKTGFGIEDFKKSLQTEVVKLRTVSEQFPNNWLGVKKAIEEHTSGSQHYLSFEAYQEICKQNHLVTEQAQKLLLKYFNTIGTVTWFGEDVHLQFMHVLNPAWITQGVYKILTAKKTAILFGQVEVKDFKELLQPVNKDDYTYDEKHYGYILSMMKKFDLCYSPDDKHLLIPSAFGKVPKLEYSDFRGDGVRVYILQFKDYMPMALIHRFTAQKMPDVVDNNYWYTGIVIKDNLSDAIAMVHADREAKRIYIRIKGESKLGLWEYVRRDFAAIASSYARIPYDELLALDDKSVSVVNYDDLVSHVKAQKPVYFHPKLQKDYNVGYLMSLFEPKENTTDKIVRGEIVLGDRERNIVPVQVPPFVLNILNNNSPVVNAEFNTQINVDIDIQAVHEKGSSLKGDADYLLEALGDSNKALSEALQKIMQFADDVKAARNSGDVKEKGWGRKLRNVLDTLGAAGENLKNMQDGGEVVKSILSGIKDLAHHFNLEAISSWFS